MTDVGEYVRDDEVMLLDGVRGVDYLTVFDIYSNDAAPGTCGGFVIGDPWAAPAWPTIRAAGRAYGTDAPISVSAQWLIVGDAVTPARFSITVLAIGHDLVFDEGADGSMQITVEIVNGSGSIEDWLFKGELYIDNSALRAA